MPANVKTQRLELQKVQAKYTRIADAIEGESAVKARGKEYLPVPSGCEKGDQDERYKAYLKRALYYNVCQPTRDALVGQLFLRAPIIVLPDELKPLIEDMNGEGLNLEQLVRLAANHVLPYGRGGFLADFPQTNKEVTRAEIQSGEIRPIIRFFEPWAIRNWKVEKIGNVMKLTLLVLDEMYEYAEEVNPFNIETKLRQRVYKLVDGCCMVEVYDDNGEIIETYQICGSNGLPLDSIPFEFIGSVNNDAEIDEPPFINLANINLAHYRNSADYEESCFLCGQPTPVYSGLTEDWVNNYFKNGIPFGSRASVPLPQGAKAELLQASPNTMTHEAMKHKEDLMFSIGAKIVDRGQKVERKEAEVEIEAASQKSVLTTIKENLELALFAAVKRAASFIGVEISDDEHKIELNENFDLTSMSADEIRSTSELYRDKLITWTEMRESLKRSGIAKTDNDEAMNEIKEHQKFIDEVTPKPEPGTITGQGKPPAKPTTNQPVGK